MWYWALSKQRRIHKFGTASGVSYHLLQLFSHQLNFISEGAVLISVFKSTHDTSARCGDLKGRSFNNFINFETFSQVMDSKLLWSGSVLYHQHTMNIMHSRVFHHLYLKCSPLYCRGRERNFHFSKVFPGETLEKITKDTYSFWICSFLVEHDWTLFLNNQMVIRILKILKNKKVVAHTESSNILFVQRLKGDLQSFLLTIEDK